MLWYFLTALFAFVVVLLVSYIRDVQRLCYSFKNLFRRFILYTTMVEFKEDNPPAEEQKEILSRLLVKSVIAGENWYLINSKWMKTLKIFIGIIRTLQFPTNPGPIDNSSILGANLRDLKKGLAENIDYELVSEECWDLLVEWYDRYQDQTPIRRKAISAGVNYAMVEVYLVDIKCYNSFELHREQKLSVSKVQLMSSVHSLIRERYHINEFQISRLWVMIGSKDNFKLLDLNVSVQNAGIINNPTIILDVQSVSGQWLKNWRLKEHSNSYNQPSTSKQVQSYVQSVPSTSYIASTSRCSVSAKPGICGLNNLGNTCFMNSVIQCMSNSFPVTEYFLAGNHLAELNVLNPMGMRGEIAKAYAELIQTMWSGKFSSVNPLNFKVQVGKFNHQFCGCQQHDAQELLTFLLDGLHEDLNRIINKPYVPNKDYTGQEDDIFAEESWNKYKLRNDSVIVDNFHGLLKSGVICPKCESLSVAFDPFCFLSLPLPLSKEHQFKVKFIPYCSKKKEVFYKIILPEKCLVKDLCHEIGLRTLTEPSHMVVTELTNGHIHSFFSPDESLEYFEDLNIFTVYELNIDLNCLGSEFALIPVCFWEKCKPFDKFTFDRIFGVPLLAILNKRSNSKAKLMTTITNLMGRHFFNSMDLSDSELTSSSSEGEYPYIPIFQPNIYELDMSRGDSPVKLKLDGHDDCSNIISNLFDTQDPDQIFSRKMLVVQLSAEQKKLLFSELTPDYGHDFHITRLTESERLVINDCFDLFTTSEKLGYENAWYCPNCRDHQRATKKFDLWMLPKILIIHLKRFSFGRDGDKIDTYVEFPMTGLCLSQYIINPAEREVTYDLVGVINHYGTMMGGHYTAYCKNKNLGKWYSYDDEMVTPMKEDFVMSQAAYVLFYMRSDNVPDSGVTTDAL